MHRARAFGPILAAALAALLLGGCAARSTLVIISGSENETLEPIIRRFERAENVKVEMHYKGSVDIMLELQGQSIPYDAVWPANSLWIALGDSGHRRVKHATSIMTSPVVFGIRESLAERLGFVGRKVSVADLLEAIRADELRFMMTSATQSNSGASAYLGFLYALAGNPDVLTMDHLRDPTVAATIRELLGGIHRSSGSSGWLKELFLESDYDAMVNYEAMVIEANQELVRRGREPLRVIYPVDGIVIADSPLGYINKGDPEKEAAFLALQEYLLSDEVQNELSQLGRRTGMGGITDSAPSDVFNVDWGVDTGRILSPIRMPSAEVIYEALRLYQTEFRKPSYTVFCLDYSGSMEGDGERSLEEAMELLLMQEQAERVLLHAGEEDVFVVLPFSTDVLDMWQVEGNDPDRLRSLLEAIRRQRPNGSTDIYTPVIVGMEVLRRVPNLDAYMPAIILMTDGESNFGRGYGELAAYWQNQDMDVPVFAITFGQASEEQLEGIARLARGRVFDGRHDLAGTFRKVKGYN